MYQRYLPTGPNRTMCSVLDEMRKCDETKNYSYLLSLIEEVQVMANRMEEGLMDISDIKDLRRAKKELVEEIRELEKEEKKIKDRASV